jgi:hypothetical protein
VSPGYFITSPDDTLPLKYSSRESNQIHQNNLPTFESNKTTQHKEKSLSIKISAYFSSPYFFLSLGPIKFTTKGALFIQYSIV